MRSVVSLVAGLPLLAAGLGCLLWAASVPTPTPVPIRVHEWGTFTALDDAQGQPMGGINVDDEPVPMFVHQLKSQVLTWPHAAGFINSQSWRSAKGVPEGYPLVTLRLETPVLYFYLPPGQKESPTIDVDVAFQGGWLSEFFPNARVTATGLAPNGARIGPLNASTIGQLSWKNVRIGTDGVGPTTSDEVWLAPRKVQAATVTVGGAELEKFLFYRGVGCREAPLSVSLDAEARELNVRGRFANVLPKGESARIGALWLVHIRADGTAAYRTLPPLTVTTDDRQIIARTAAAFEPDQFATDALDRLRTEMHAALMTDGLYDDEATALLNTWRRAYFRNAGLRLFFLVPRAWTDHVLPLRLSVSAEVTRVMVGRIELTSPEQRQLLAQLSTMPVAEPKWIKPPKDGSRAANWQRFLSGHSDFGPLGVTIPPEYQVYLGLGRFRNALALDALRRRPTPSLERFVKLYQLRDQAGTGAAK